jgi:hypothetical protein
MKMKSAGSVNVKPENGARSIIAHAIMKFIVVNASLDTRKKKIMSLPAG